MHPRWTYVSASFLVSLAASACKSDERPKGSAPPPIESSKPGACAAGGGKVDDALTRAFFPRKVEAYCVDPNGETKTYGVEAKKDIGKACTEVLDGECEVYKRYGLDRVVEVRYIDGAGSPGSVNLRLSRFKTAAGAFSFYTRRVIADADPDKTTMKPLKLSGAGALGSGSAVIWRDVYVGELSYTNELEPPAKLRASSAKVLPPLATAVAAKISGKTQLPPAAAALPTADRIPLGVGYEHSALLGVQGIGAGAFGYYKSAGKRWRIFVAERADDDAAKDVMKSVKKLTAAKSTKGVPIEAVTFALSAVKGGPKLRWAVARKGKTVYGVGDEEMVVDDGMKDDEIAKLSLSDEEKLAKLKSLVAP